MIPHYFTINPGTCRRNIRSNGGTTENALAAMLPPSCINVDFSYRILANGEVRFTDISSSLGSIINWEWTFGDGAISTAQNPTHTYNLNNYTGNEACLNVKLKVRATGGIEGSETKRICIPRVQSGGTSLFVKIISPNEIYDGVCNTEIAKIIESTVLEPNPTSFEGSVLGGTPPYTYRWSFPPSASSQSLVGQGPHMVTFTSPSAIGITCPTEFVNLDVTDARGVRGTASMKISVRKKDEGPGAITVSASKTPICVGEYITFKPKIDNPFAINYNYLNVSVAATYKLIVDNVGIDYGPLNRMIYRFTTAGQHTVGLEITDGGTVYRATPITVTVRSEIGCNKELPAIPDFALRINGEPNGRLILDANNNANLCTDNSSTRKITVRVPRTIVPMDPSAPRCGGDCLPFYFFGISIISSNGVSRKLSSPCGVNPDAFLITGSNGGPPVSTNVVGRTNVITEPFLRELGKSRTGNELQYINYITDSDGKKFIEFTLPICFSNCGPLIGCNQLDVTVGRFALENNSLYPPISGICRNAFPLFYEGYDDKNFDCTNNSPCSNSSTQPLIGKVGLLSSVSCAIEVKENYPPLNISGITTDAFNCSNSAYTFTIPTGAISGGIPFDLSSTSSYISCESPYKAIKWKAYYFNNPNREITNFITPIANSADKRASVGVNHEYFSNNFAAGEQRLFIVEASVADWDGNVAKYSMLVAFDAPLAVTLPDKIKRCKGDNITLSNIPIVQGGTATTANPYTYSWSSTAAIFKTTGSSILSASSAEPNPTLNLSNVTTSVVDVTLTVSPTNPNNGCSVEAKTRITIENNLKPFTLSDLTLTACANSSSVLTIGPMNCTPSTPNCFGGSGEYIYRWSAVNATDVDYLSDPTIAYPKVSGFPVLRYGLPAYYNLTISDLYGGCSVTSPAPVTISSQQSETTFSVDLGADKILCSPNTDKLIATPVNAGTNPAIYQYKWESATVTNLPTNLTTREIALSSLPSGSKNTFKVTLIDPKSNCSTTDEIVVETRKPWTYRGYEPVIAPLLTMGGMGTMATFWTKPSIYDMQWVSNTDNKIFVNNEFGSGAVPRFTYSVPTIPMAMVFSSSNQPPNDNGGAPIQGVFFPSENNLSTKVLITDNNGCSKEFESNTYYLLGKPVNVTVSTDKQVVCSGGDICFYLKLYTNIVAGQKYLPTSFKVPYNLKEAIFLNTNVWDYRTFSNPINGLVEFVLTDANAGIYTAIACVKTPPVSSRGIATKYAFLIDGSLPNTPTGVFSNGIGTFKVEHRFNASGGPIRLEHRQSGTINTYYPRQAAFNFVSLGTEFYVISPQWDPQTGVRNAPLKVNGNAQVEFTAGKPGEVRIENDVQVDNPLYFHAFIDPCLLPSDKLKNDDTDESPSFLSVKTNKPKYANGAFSVRPSPFGSSVTLDYEVRSEKGSNVTLAIYNGIGQIVDRLFENRFHDLGVFSTTYDTDKLRPGIYLFEITIDGERIVKKSMKVD